MKIKKWIALAVSVCMMVAMVPAGVYAEYEPKYTDDNGNMYDYQVTDEAAGTVVITYRGNKNGSAGTIDVPTVIKADDKEYRVTALFPSAFGGQRQLEHITLGPDVTEIGSTAFGSCSNLKSVTMPGVTTIGMMAFAECKSLKTLEIPVSVTKIETGAFAFCDSLNLVYEGSTQQWEALAGDKMIGNPGFTVIEPQVESVSMNSITVQQIEGAEYRINNGTWQESNVFDGLVPASAYSVQLRFKETVDKKHMVSVAVQVNTPPAINSGDGQNSKIINGVSNTRITAKTSLLKNGNIKVTWKKSKGYKVDYYQVYRADSKNGKAKLKYQSSNGQKTLFINNKSLKKGNRYYYKVRGARVIDGKTYYTKWSNVVYRTVK